MQPLICTSFQPKLQMKNKSNSVISQYNRCSQHHEAFDYKHLPPYPAFLTNASLMSSVLKFSLCSISYHKRKINKCKYN